MQLLSLAKSVEKNLGDALSRKSVVSVATQNYEDLMAAFISHKLNSKVSTVFLRTGLENKGSLERIKEFADSCGWQYDTFDASSCFEPLAKAVTYSEKVDAYRSAVVTALEQIGVRYKSSALVSGNLLSPSFEEGADHSKYVRLNKVSVHTPLSGHSLPVLNQFLGEMGLSQHLSVYSLSRAGVAAQCIGEVSQEKVNILSEADDAVRSALGGLVPGRHSFTAVADNRKVKPRDKSLIENLVYNSFKSINTFFTDIGSLEEQVPTAGSAGRMLLVNVKDDMGEQFIPNSATVMALQHKMLTIDQNTRVGYCIASGNPEGRYILIMRHFESIDFKVAVPSERNWNKLQEAAKKMLSSNSDLAACYVDLSTKPPAKVGYI
ncbi:MAG: hypothetical protein QW767_00965 [Thermoprotei archaeon]